MRKMTSWSGRTLASLILLGIGAVFLTAGALVSTLFINAIDANAARIAVIEQVDGAALRGATLGREVLLEGHISSDQPIVLRDFVAYIREERERSQKEPKPWRTREIVAPPLHIETSTGAVQVVNEGYVLAPISGQSDPRTSRIETRYRGIRPGEEVLVVGKTAPGGVAAEFVSVGTRESYLQSRALSSTLARWLGRLFLVLGTLMMAVGALIRRLAR